MVLSGLFSGVRRLVSTVATSAGAASAGKVPHLGSTGLLSGTMTMVYSGAGVPVDYTDGSPPATGEGVTLPGSLYIDVTNKKMYINGGTQAQPIWKIFTSA